MGPLGKVQIHVSVMHNQIIGINELGVELVCRLLFIVEVFAVTR